MQAEKKSRREAKKERRKQRWDQEEKQQQGWKVGDGRPGGYTLAPKKNLVFEQYYKVIK